jgi:two-component system, cell cycle sensor histidine kinase and response regulator CckA
MREDVETYDGERLRQLQKVETIGRLAAGIAHDFNNILTAIVGYADLLAQSESSPRVEDVVEIRRAAERAAGLTRKILAFTRPEAAGIDIIDVNEIVADMSRMLRQLIDENIELRVDCRATSATVRIDAGHVEQVIGNLVANARDAVPVGRISISTRSFVADTSFAAAHPGVSAGQYVALEVADDGHGMTEDVLAHLFEPFFTTKTADGGTGLGLSIVSSILRQSGGDILVESTPGRGSRFTVLLPFTDGSVDTPDRTSIERRCLDGGATILIAEDQEQVRSIAALWLRRCGYTVFEASDGEEALALVARGGVQPDLLITDVVMPNIGGVPLADFLRTVFPRLKVIYISGYENRPELQGRLPEDGVAFLQKPFSPGRLLSQVRTSLMWSGTDRRTMPSLEKFGPAAAARTAGPAWFPRRPSA